MLESVLGLILVLAGFVGIALACNFILWHIYWRILKRRKDNGDED